MRDDKAWMRTIFSLHGLHDVATQTFELRCVVWQMWQIKNVALKFHSNQITLEEREARRFFYSYQCDSCWLHTHYSQRPLLFVGLLLLILLLLILFVFFFIFVVQNIYHCNCVCVWVSRLAYRWCTRPFSAITENIQCNSVPLTLSIFCHLHNSLFLPLYATKIINLRPQPLKMTNAHTHTHSPSLPHSLTLSLSLDPPIYLRLVKCQCMYNVRWSVNIYICIKIAHQESICNE